MSAVALGSGQRFAMIDVLRGAAALLVLAYHVAAHRWPGLQDKGFGHLVRNGWVGVDLFLVISGFVIALAALNAQAIDGRHWRRTYAERRLRRIVPLYLATLVCTIWMVSPGLLQHGWAAVVHIAMHLGFVHNLWHETHGSINPPNWSVGLEMQFYLLMALVTPWIARASVLRIYLLWVAVALGWRLASTFWLPPGASSPILQFIYASQLPGTLDEFATGIVLAKWLKSGHLRPDARLFWRALLAAVLLSVVAWRLVPGEATYWSKPVAIVGARTLLSLAFGAMVVCAICWPWTPGRFSRPLRYLGEISYGIYLWHMPVLATLIERTQLQGSRLLKWTIVGTVVLATLSWYGFERLWLQPQRRRPETGSAG